MPDSKPQPITIDVDAQTRVSPSPHPSPRSACFLFAHRRGCRHGASVHGCGRRRRPSAPIASLRYHFLYGARRKRPDPPRRARGGARRGWPSARQLNDVPLIAGGKSFGGRMTSQAQASAPLEGVAGLAFLGFPLHPAKQPSRERARHLADVTIPMLFLQGTRDALAELGELEPVCAALGSRATLKLFAEADHSFHVPARTGRKDAEVRADMLDTFAAWAARVVGNAIGITPSKKLSPRLMYLS